MAAPFRNFVSKQRLARVVLPLAVLAIVLGGVTWWMRPEVQHPASAVIRQIHDIALAGADPSSPRGANMLGPWALSAQKVDVVSGSLVGFRVESGDVIVAARSAEVRVDPVEDTFSFVLVDVTYTTLPLRSDLERSSSVPVEAATLVHHLDRYILGPIPFGGDIVADGGAAPMPRSTPELLRENKLAGIDDYAASD